MRTLEMIFAVVGAFWILCAFLLVVGIVAFVRGEHRAGKVR